MADLKTQFEQAVKDSKSLPEKPDNMTLLKIYALYKPAPVTSPTSAPASPT
jgi:diazepam-binding inhibitor (GABA receptor modulator, acyl-CoA-binding protein)